MSDGFITTSARAARRWSAFALLLFVPFAAALIGAKGPGSIVLNLGPGDSHFVSGFSPEYEVEGTSRVHWTTKHAVIELPLTVTGGPTTLSYRFARPLPGPAEVDVFWAGVSVDQFSFPGGRFRERAQEVSARPRAPVQFSFVVDASHPDDLGLRLDWIRFALGEDGVVRLDPVAALRPALVPALTALCLLALGWPRRRAVALAAPGCALVVVGLLTDPWLTFRLSAYLPGALGVGAAAALLFSRRLIASQVLSARDIRLLGALLMATFLVRAGAVNHPDFYHPDLRTHARFVQTIRAAGLAFLVSPSEHILSHGVWKREAYGEEYAFPYSPAFHLPFVSTPLDYDALVGLMPVVAAGWSVVPIALLWWLARKAGLSLWGAILMAFVPSYMSRLSFVFMPSLFGHVFDVALVVFFALSVGALGSARVVWRGAALIAGSQLAYTSGVLNSTAFIFAFIAVLIASAPRERSRALAVVVMLTVASSFSVLIFYRDFIGMVFDIASRAAAGAEGSESLYPIRSLWAVASERTTSFFGYLYPVLTVLGLGIWFRRGGGERFAAGAWLTAYVLLLLGRAKMPDLFSRGHEALFVTPLVCLASAEALAWIERRGGGGKLVAIALFAVLAVQGLYYQWRAIAASLLPTVS